MAAMVSIGIIMWFVGVLRVWVSDQFAWFSIHLIVRRIAASPIRFLNSVIIPAPRDFGFW